MPSDAPAIDKEEVTAIQPDTEQVVEEAETLTTPDPVVAKTDNIISSPAKIANELTDDAALWTPVIDNLKAFGDTTVTATDTSWLFIFFAGFLGGCCPADTLCMAMIPMTVSFFLKRTKTGRKPSAMH